MERILITGANRGIGLEIARQLLVVPDVFLIVTCRNPDNADSLQRLVAHNPQRIRIIALDIADSESIAVSVSQVQREFNGLDGLINNAGIFPKEDRARRLADIDGDMIANILEVNAVGPLMVTQAYVDLLKQGNNPRVMMVSSQMGALDRPPSSGGYGYRMSKAALNMAARTLSYELGQMGITVITTHPGWVQTDMGGSSAAITPQESASGLIKLMQQLTPADNGKFYKWTGEIHPW